MRVKEDDKGIQNYRGPWAGYGETLYNGALTQEQKDQLAKAEETKQIRIEEAKIQEKNFEPYSIFHWGNYHDYKGLSYVEPPVDYKRGGEVYFLLFRTVIFQRKKFSAGLEAIKRDFK